MTTALYLIPLWLGLSLPIGMLIGQMIAVAQGYGDDGPPARSGSMPETAMTRRALPRHRMR